MSSNAKEGFFGLISGLIMAGAAACAALIWGYQLLAFAKGGSWLPLSVNDGLFWLTDHAWFHSPDSWFGVHKVLDYFNAGWGLLITAFVALVVAMKLLGLE